MSRTKALSSALLIVLAGSFLYGNSHAQTASKQLDSGVEAPFGSINESLYRAADRAFSMSGGTSPTRLANPTDQRVLTPAEPPSGDTTQRSESLVESILLREGIPSELSAVVKVESSGNRFALSQKGARGLWQLMPDTARRYGLQVDSRVDERTDVAKSTTAAAKYLHDLYAQFGSWPLALAAYNTGESNLQRAINRAQSNQFAVLSFLRVIPAETRSYVPAVLANITLPLSSLRSYPATESIPVNLVYAGTGFPKVPSEEDKR